MSESVADDHRRPPCGAGRGGGPVVELQDDDARNFMFVAPESIVLGSFSMLNGAFFVLAGTTYGYRDSHQEQDFQLRAYTPRSKVVLTTNKADAQGVVWSYSASLLDAKNALRKQVFREAAGADSIVHPIPGRGCEPVHLGGHAFDRAACARACRGQRGYQRRRSQ